MGRIIKKQAKMEKHTETEEDDENGNNEKKLMRNGRCKKKL